MEDRNPSRRREELYRLLGKLPPRDRPIEVLQRTPKEHPDYKLEELLLDLNGIENVPALFVAPKDVPPPWPVVLYHHAHGGNYKIAKDELLEGRGALRQPPYAIELTRMGYAALCCDTWAFGRAGNDDGVGFVQADALAAGRSCGG